MNGRRCGTVADMEIVLDDGPYRAVVTFLPRDQVLDYVEECRGLSWSARP